MKSKYAEKMLFILNTVRPRLKSTHNLELKNCFGAVAGYVNDEIFCSCGKFGFALKLPRKTITILILESDIKHLKYFSKGHIKKDYLVLPKRIVSNKEDLKKLVDKSIKFVSNLD